MKIVHHAKTVAKYYYWILHDKDFYGDAPEDSENPHAAGEIKKPHIHLLFKFNNSRDLKTVQNYFKEFEELKENSFEVIRNDHGAKRYLTHADNPEKYQYQIHEVETNDKMFPNCFLEKMSSIDEFNTILDAFEIKDKMTCRQYCERFYPALQNANGHNKLIALYYLRSEWRRLNAVKEADYRNDLNKIPY
jgi:hypothetical protein